MLLFFIVFLLVLFSSFSPCVIVFIVFFVCFCSCVIVSGSSENRCIRKAKIDK